MAKYNETLYQAPTTYINAHQLADEANDLRYLHASSAVIKVNSIPIVAIENLNIAQTINKTPINVIGSMVPLGFDTQGVTVNVSGSLVQLAKMSLNDSVFYPADEVALIASLNRVFIISISMYDPTQENDADVPMGNFIEIVNCQTTGSNITISPNTNIKDSFTAVGTFSKRAWTELATFNQINT